VALARSHRTASAPHQTGMSAPSNGRDGALLARLREVFAQEGLRESHSAEQEGLFFTIEGRDEASLQYIEAEREEVPGSFTPSSKARATIFLCYSALSGGDYVLTLVSSSRMLGLHVRYDVRSGSSNSSETAG
jgi:hypothetical protein